MLEREIPLIFDMDNGFEYFFACDVPQSDVDTLLGCPARASVDLPNVAEPVVVRHFTQLSQMNYGVDAGFYPLGSCTMKYNPKVNEQAASLPGFCNVHPLQPIETTQGCMQIWAELNDYLCVITGMDAYTLQPAAGAQGEMTGLMIMRAYFAKKGEKRTKALIPDAAHGTNPASAAMAGLETVTVPSNERGGVDVEALQKLMDEDVACLMLTNPNTLGLFEENVEEIAAIVHEKGGLLYYDGANLNATMGIVRPGDMGFDVVHLNLHKTFSTPHGGGGPGSGPVGVKAHLEGFLPGSGVRLGDDGYEFFEHEHSIGCVKSFHGHFLVALKAYAYIRALGSEGLRRSTEAAVLNANYLRVCLRDAYEVPYDRICMHEVVLGRMRLADGKVSTLDVAKRLLDYGYHPPTVYFPLIVKEAMMIEPTETESLEELDGFVDAMKRIASEAAEDAGLLSSAPHDTQVLRLDETLAARKPRLKA